MRPWAKMDSGLDRNRKIRRGGREAREVFLWVLRRVAEESTDGWIKAADFDDIDYVCDDLMSPRDAVVTGVTRCFEVELLARDAEKVFVVGWGDEWAKGPSDGAARTRKWRHNKTLRESVTVGDVTGDVVVTSGDANVSRDGSEKKRREKKRGEGTRARARSAGPSESSAEAPTSEPSEPAKGKHHPETQVALDGFHEMFKAKRGVAPTWPFPEIRRMDQLVRLAGGADEVMRRARIMFASAPRWPADGGGDLKTLAAHFDRFASQAPRSGRPGAAGGAYERVLEMASEEESP